jgi:endonuclease III
MGVLMGKSDHLLCVMGQIVTAYPPPLSVQLVARYGRDPFLVLIACLLSLRARDVLTEKIVHELFAQVRSPEQLCHFPEKRLRDIIKPLGMYKRRALVLKTVSCRLVRDFGGHVPATERELLSLDGVGRKTAQLVLGEAFGKPALCVDTHVHRIANHLGLVATKTPAQTEIALKKLFKPAQWRFVYQTLLVWGQQVCKSGKKVCVCRKVLRDAGLDWK